MSWLSGSSRVLPRLCVNGREHFVARVNAHTHTHTRAYARYFVNARNRDSIGSGAAANNYTCPIRHAKLLLDSRGRLERAAGTSDDLEISSRN